MSKCTLDLIQDAQGVVPERRVMRYASSSDPVEVALKYRAIDDEMDPSSLNQELIERIVQFATIDDYRQLVRSCLISKAFTSACGLKSYWLEALRLRGWTLTWDRAADPRNVFRMLCEMSDSHRERLLLLNLEGVTTIEEKTFRNANLSSLTELPPTLTNIGEYAFQDANLSSLTALPPTLTTIGAYAFYDANLSSLTALPPLTTIAPGAFNEANLALLPRGDPLRRAHVR